MRIFSMFLAGILFSCPAIAKEPGKKNRNYIEQEQVKIQEGKIYIDLDQGQIQTRGLHSDSQGLFFVEREIVSKERTIQKGPKTPEDPWGLNIRPGPPQDPKRKPIARPPGR